MSPYVINLDYNSLMDNLLISEKSGIINKDFCTMGDSNINRGSINLKMTLKGRFIF